MLSDRCLSVLPCLSVTFVHCGQTVERIKMKLGKQIGLGLATVIDGDQRPLSQRGTTPTQFSVHICWRENKLQW